MEFYRWRLMISLAAALDERRRGTVEAPAAAVPENAGMEPALLVEAAAAPSSAQPKLTMLEQMQLWRARHRHRQELAMMSDRDLKDACVAPDLVPREIAKWPWQTWNPQWRELDEVLIRGLALRPRRQLSSVPLSATQWRWAMAHRHIAMATTVMVVFVATLSAALIYLR